jgi:hypothetical protein
MAKTYEALNAKLREFIAAQRIYFVGSAPLAANGSINLSPKGFESLVVLDERTVAYLDLGGSGIETVAHVRENSRITLMFCAFEGPANIVRIYGRGRVIQFDEPEFVEWRARFSELSSGRSVIVVDIERVTDSCGWGVPFYDFKSERDQLTRALNHMDDEAMHNSFYGANATSVDGLPGILPAERLTGS